YRIRMKRKEAIQVELGKTYTFSDSSSIDSNLKTWMILQFLNGEIDKNNTLFVNRGRSRTFESAGDEILITAMEDDTNTPIDIGDLTSSLKVKMEEGAHKTAYNTPLNILNAKRNVNVVENISELENSKHLRTGDLLETKGFYECGDGGGAKYLIASEASGEFPETITVSPNKY